MVEQEVEFEIINRAPFLAMELPDLLIHASTNLYQEFQQAAFHDPDGDELNFTMKLVKKTPDSPSPTMDSDDQTYAWISFAYEPLRIKGRPGQYAIGEYYVFIKFCDLVDCALARFSLNIFNNAPVAHRHELNITISCRERLSYHIPYDTCVDPDNDLVSY